MFSVGADWNPKQSYLKELIRKPEYFDEAINLCSNMHAMIHSSKITNMPSEPNLEDEVLDNLSYDICKRMPTIKDVTIAWNIWHITRIEDLTMNLLVAGENQVLSDDWLEKLNTNITDTANAMTDEEIISFSESINMVSLIHYRNEVGIRSQEILKKLTKSDMKRKFTKDAVNRILTEGGLTTHPDSIWLLDFWGKKDVAGILLMPLTRHQVGHLNDCLKLRKKCER